MRRLQNRAQFQAVLAGTTVARSGHFVLHRLQLPVNLPQPRVLQHIAHGAPPEKPTLSESVPAGTRRCQPALFDVSGNWLGAMVPKRWAKRAVTRNMIKRRIYSLAEAASMRGPAGIAQAAYVVRLRSGFDPRIFKSATSAPLSQAVSLELSSLFAQGFQLD